ncbi:MAG: hypothetical protein N3A63_04170 [Bacteroidetes bacterium]|nr:hypothetical protein [Bacteroidota bacterium]
MASTSLLNNVLTVSFLLTIPTVWSYTQQATVIELRSAQRLEGKMVGDEEVRELIGNVHFTQPTKNGGRVYVWCDRAIRYMVQNRLELYGNVKVQEGEAILTSNEGFYNANTRVMEVHTGVRLQQGVKVLTARHGIYYVDEKWSYFHTDVRVEDSSTVITCYELWYFEREARSVARDSVHIYNKVSKYHIYGDSLEYREKESLSIIPKNPRLVKIDTTNQGVIDTTVVESTTMKFFQAPEEKLLALGNVQMARSDLATKCNYAMYLRMADSILLTNAPIVWSGNNQVTGDSIFVKIEQNELRRVTVHGHAMAISLSDSLTPTRFNQLSGKYLTMYFRDNTLQHIDVQRNAMSFYYVFDNSVPNGANKISGEHIEIVFEEGEVATLRVHRGVEGQYIPERMLAGKESEYNLDGFHWRIDRPKRSGLRITHENNGEYNDIRK